MTREKRILEAALGLFARQGFEGTSIRDIASDAGINSATLYHYMGTKEDLLVKIMERGTGRLIESAVETLSGLETPEQQLAALVQLHVASHAIDRESALVIDTEFRSLSRENKRKVESQRNEYEALWRKALELGSSAEVFDIAGAKLAGFALLQMCTGVAHWYSSEGPSSLRDVETSFADMALALVRARRDGRALRVADLELPDPVRFYPSEVYGREEAEA